MFLEDVGFDLRCAVRMMRRSPAFSAVAVLSLALGIGANTSIFSVIDALMLRPLPVDRPSRLVIVRTKRSDTVPYSTFDTLRDASADVADLSAIVRTDRYNVTISGDAGTSASIDPGPGAAVARQRQLFLHAWHRRRGRPNIRRSARPCRKP
jgi:hypothetical protein